MRDINDLNLVGTTGINRRVETKDVGADNQEVLVRYPRPSAGLGAEEKARVASFASKSLAHLGYEATALNTFVQGLFTDAEASISKAAEAEAGCGDTIVVNGITYVRQ